MSQPSILLINANQSRPPVAPLAIDYLAGALRRAGRETDFLDLTFAGDPEGAVHQYFAAHSPRLVGITFRNSDDCFWPSATSFVPRLIHLVRRVRGLTEAPVVLGGAGYSVFPTALLAASGAEWGVQGDGEEALVSLAEAVEQGGDVYGIPGLVWRRTEGRDTTYVRNPPAPPAALTLSTAREFVDNRRYFREGGQANLETKRGCPRDCTYCADPLIKGRRVRTRDPRELAEEVENLLRQGLDLLHLCDGEFNVPGSHALEVCHEWTRRGLGSRVRWYTYASIVPFSDELAEAMRRAGCVGINFGADSACDQMLATYGRKYRQEAVGEAIRRCRRQGLRVMIDLLLGGPGETEATLRETLEFLKAANPDCVGAALGVRLYPGTRLAVQLLGQGALDSDPSLRRRTDPFLEGLSPEVRLLSHGLLQPAFYISQALGERPAQLVRDLIGDDARFFEPVDEQSLTNYNYHDHQPLIDAIRGGARGAYWDLLRNLREPGS